jgi:hypothetical protein
MGLKQDVPTKKPYGGQAILRSSAGEDVAGLSCQLFRTEVHDTRAPNRT